MIKREHIKQAIEAVSRRDPEIGYALDELLGMERIYLADHEISQEDLDPKFFIDGQKVIVKRISYFLDGLAPLEQRLVLKFGELLKREEIQEKGSNVDFFPAIEEIRLAGLDLLVNHELAYAMERLKKSAQAHGRNDSKGTDKLKQILISIREDKERCPFWLDDPPGKIYTGVVNIDTPAFLMPFPYCFEALRQVAELNLEFFHVRFVLDCLLSGESENLFVCVVDGIIAGISYICLRGSAFSPELEIKYISTVRGLKKRYEESIPEKRIKGAGTFLISGIWMLWKSGIIEGKTLVLDAELGSRDFYESLGFETSSPMTYVLKQPKGYLLSSIINMFLASKPSGQQLLEAVKKAVLVEIKSLAKRRKKSSLRQERKITVNCLAKCLQPEVPRELSQAVISKLFKYKGKISEAFELLKMASELDLARTDGLESKDKSQLLIVHDSRFAQHLEGIFHLDSPQRTRIVNEILFHERLSDKWQVVESRPASPEELLFVHTPEYIETIAGSEGKPLTTFDLDTQATALSYQTAALAAGSVMALLEAVWSGTGARGFAFVRPPGHHAEPDRAMGFCIFNNIALGCEFLLRNFNLDRIMVVDLDAHHGNGIQKVFYQTDKVLYLSCHQAPAYPGTGKLGEAGQGKGLGFTVNVPLPAGQDDIDYCQIIHWLVAPLAKAYQPEIMVIACGFDLYPHDILAKMDVSPEGYGQMTRMLVRIAEGVCKGKIVYVMEGGYSPEGIRTCGLETVMALCDLTEYDTSKLDRKIACREIPLSLRKVVEVHKKYWQCLR